MNTVVRISEQFAQSLDAEDYETARGLLCSECKYMCRGELYVGPDAIIKSYQNNGVAAEREFDIVKYESSVIETPDGAALIQFADHLSLKEKHFTFRCEQVVRVSENGLIIRIEHRDIPGLREALAAFREDKPAGC